MMHNKQSSSGPYVHLNYSLNGTGTNASKLATTYSTCGDDDDDDSSLGSSVASGLRNSLHSSYDFKDLHDIQVDRDGYYAGYDSFGESTSGTGESYPSWRLDPSTSGSDWTMIIQSEADGDCTNYHVHQSLLSEGFKRCDFFKSLFQFGDDNHNKNQMSPQTISVYGDAVCLIPTMLDYLYSPHDILDVTSEHAVGLYYLSQFFGNRALAAEVLSFICDDLTMANMRTYLASCAIFDDLQTLKLCAQHCSKHIMEIKPSSSLLREMDAGFLLDIIVSVPREDKKSISVHTSTLVSAFCNLRHKEMDASVFHELTLAEYIPVIQREVVLDLLVMEAKLVPESRNESDDLSCLQERCITALSEPCGCSSSSESPSLQKKREKKRLATKLALAQLPRKVLVELLSRNLEVQC